MAEIDKNLCIGCGACVSLCPKSFQMNDEDGKADAVSGDDVECANNAAESCPVQAITVN